jgi:hypothetical protein
MGENMTGMDWTTEQDVAEVIGEELSHALQRVGVQFIGVACADAGDEISVAFRSIEDATRAIDLGVPYVDQLGGFYDRATSSCLTLSALAAEDVHPDDRRVADALDTGWTWVIHPDRSGPGNRMAWHASVDMTPSDAQQLTANLNAAYRAGGL